MLEQEKPVALQIAQLPLAAWALLAPSLGLLLLLPLLCHLFHRVPSALMMLTETGIEVAAVVADAAAAALVVAIGALVVTVVPAAPQARLQA